MAISLIIMVYQHFQYGGLTEQYTGFIHVIHVFS